MSFEIGRGEKMLLIIFPLGIMGAAQSWHQALPWNATVSLIAAFKLITALM